MGGAGELSGLGVQEELSFAKVAFFGQSTNFDGYLFGQLGFVLVFE